MKSKKLVDNRRWGIALVAVFATSLLGGLGITAAIAGTAYSSYGYYTVNGHEYVSRAIISTATNNATAVTNNQWNGGGTWSGWAGARGRLFTSGGSLSCEGSNVYNSGTGTLAVGYSCQRLYAGTWYSYGVALGWNGGGYTSFYTYQSPNQNS